VSADAVASTDDDGSAACNEPATTIATSAREYLFTIINSLKDVD
jgi:hypothetical protein